MHHPGHEDHKPNVIPRKLDKEKQNAFIEGYAKLLNFLIVDAALLFAEAVHPTAATRPVGCCAPSPRSSRSADELASTPQHSRPHQHDTDKPDYQGPAHLCRLDDQASTIHRGALSMLRSCIFFWTTRFIIMPRSCRNLALRGEASRCTSSQRLNALTHSLTRPRALRCHSQHVLRNSRPSRRCEAHIWCVPMFRQPAQKEAKQSSARPFAWRLLDENPSEGRSRRLAAGLSSDRRRSQ